MCGWYTCYRDVFIYGLLRAEKQSAFKNIGWGHLFIEAVLLLWGCGILSLIGAIYISGILSDIRFFLEMNIFRGVKLTLYCLLFVFLLFIFKDSRFLAK